MTVGRWMLTSGRGYDVFPDSEDDVLRFLTEVDALARNAGEARIAVLTADPDGDGSPYLSIGVGAAESVLVYEQGDDEHGGYSEGPRSGDTTEISFRYGTGTAEFLGWMLIPKSQAFDAAGEFYRTRQRPTTIEWRDL